MASAVSSTATLGCWRCWLTLQVIPRKSYQHRSQQYCLRCCSSRRLSHSRCMEADTKPTLCTSLPLFASRWPVCLAINAQASYPLTRKDDRTIGNPMWRPSHAANRFIHDEAAEELSASDAPRTILQPTDAQWSVSQPLRQACGCVQTACDRLRFRRAEEMVCQALHC